MPNAIDIMKSYTELLSTGGHIEGEPEKALTVATGFHGAVVTPSSTEAIDAAILAARAYWSRRDMSRYWVVALAGVDHGPTGLAMQASDDTPRPERKWLTAPHAPGFAVTTPEDVVRALAGESAYPVMNTAPMAPLNRSPRIDWSSVALVLVNNAVPTPVQLLRQLKDKHGFLIAYDCANGERPMRVGADMCIWGVGVGAGIDTSVLLYEEHLRDYLPLLNYAADFTRFAAGQVAQSLR